jgi:outer membrane usher protein
VVSRLSLPGAALGVAILASHAIAVRAQDSSSDDYGFDSSLLLGTPLGVANIERFNKPGGAEPGTYRVDIYVNQVLVTRKTVDFRKMGDGEIHPCLSDTFLAASGVLVARTESGASPSASDETRDADATARSSDTPDDQCRPLAERVPGATARFDPSALRLDIGVPQTQMKRVPRGAVDPANLDAGRTVAYVSYDMNDYMSSAGNRSNAFYLGVNAGANVGLWRFQQQSALTWNNSLPGSTLRWDNLRTYAERPLISIGSKLVVGEDFTSGDQLSPIGYTGIRLETDDRMLPDSMRGYAPVVKGIANTNARVVVSQNGNVIAETTVAPGPFIIDDLNPTSYQGDLKVQVFEANGHVTTFRVPFSAVSRSLRPGQSRYGLVLGQVRQIRDSTARFADLVYERGLTNLLTVNGAARVSGDYQSLFAGTVLGTSVGAFGLSEAWSNTRDAQGRHVSGARTGISYGHTIQPTMTTFSLAGYHYSTNGYRDFLNALVARAAYPDGRIRSANRYRQRDQVTINVNQSFDRFGMLSLSASTGSYYGSRSRDTQLQLSYSNHFKSISYNLSVVRQRTGMIDGTGVPFPTAGASPAAASPQATTTVMLTVSIPFGSGANLPTLSGSVAHTTDQRMSYQTSLNGTAGASQSLNYGLALTGETPGGTQSYSGNIAKSLSIGAIGANYSQGQGYWQAGANARGAAVVHAGGVTLGPYLSGTFGIVEAEGAKGATLRNAQGVKVDRFGYAIIPSLTPYRYNDVALDTKGVNGNVELTTNEVRIAPYAGSAVLLKFETRKGRALLIHATGPDGEPLPLGADVLDGHGVTVGVVGQGGQAYARVPDTKGSLVVRWGDRQEDRCAIDYQVDAREANAAITRLDARCTPLSPVPPAPPAGRKE